MKTILLLIVICFYSCTSTGKLSGLKYSSLLTKEQINATGVTVTYNGSPTVPTSAGSYSVRASLTDRNYLGEKPKFRILKYLPYAAIGLSILLAVFLFIRKRDEEITLPDEYNENY